MTGLCYRTTVVGALLLAGVVSAAPVQATDWEHARRIAARSCQACHGLDGLSRQINAPHIAGQPLHYLERQLRAFRNGERHDPQMSIAASSLTEEEVALVAAYYSAIEIQVIQQPGQ